MIGIESQQRYWILIYFTSVSLPYLLNIFAECVNTSAVFCVMFVVLRQGPVSNMTSVKFFSMTFDAIYT